MRLGLRGLPTQFNHGSRVGRVTRDFEPASLEQQRAVDCFSGVSTDGGGGVAARLGARVGRGTKYHANPLWGQTEPWEQRIDNGYAQCDH
eukprot:m.218109 g.218109  ORF g.218109 m.218109 type:complete len:90 (+) comp15568_c0_seq5:225-494(+)